MDCPPLVGWREAFLQLEKVIAANRARKCVVFIDEMPWMDTPRSGFVSALEHFWNGWACARSNLVLIVCGSSASWIVKKIFRDHGGLHNRVTDQIRAVTTDGDAGWTVDEVNNLDVEHIDGDSGWKQYSVKVRGDGFTTAEEFVIGTDPTDPESKFTARLVEADELV